MKKIFRWSVICLGFIGAFLGILFLHFFITTEGEYPVEPTIDHNPSIPHHHVQSSALHVETFGADTNELVIVVHGGPGMDFRYLLPLKKLAKDFHMVFYDQRGTGLSPRVVASGISMVYMRKDLHQLVQTFAGGRKAHLIGHSWGAFIAIDYANSFPDKVDKLVLAEPWVLPHQKDPNFIESGIHWFESLHVKGPDRQAGPDYYLYSSLLDGQNSGTGEQKFWRYGSMARKTLLNDPLYTEISSNTSYWNSYPGPLENILYITGENHQIPREEHLIDPFGFKQDIHRASVEDAEQLFGENIESTIRDIHQFLINKP